MDSDVPDDAGFCCGSLHAARPPGLEGRGIHDSASSSRLVSQVSQVSLGSDHSSLDRAAPGPPPPNARPLRRESSRSASALKNAPQFDSGWFCNRHCSGEHHCFLSYRVYAEGSEKGNGLAERLCAALEAVTIAYPEDETAGLLPPLRYEESGLGLTGAEEAEAAPLAMTEPLTVFLDRFCLNKAENWEESLKLGLAGSALIMPLISQAALDGVARNAPAGRDNLLIEWEFAVAAAANNSAMVLPILIGPLDLRPDSYPDVPHAHGSRESVRGTLAKIFLLNGLQLSDPRGDLAPIVEATRELLQGHRLHKLRASQRQRQSLRQHTEDLAYRRVAEMIAKGQRVGEGATSEVYRGEDRINGSTVAIKVLSLSATLGPRLVYGSSEGNSGGGGSNQDLAEGAGGDPGSSGPSTGRAGASSAGPSTGGAPGGWSGVLRLGAGPGPASRGTPLAGSGGVVANGSKFARTELDIMMTLDHPNTLPLISSVQHADKFYLVMPYQVNGSLYQQLFRSTGGPSVQIRQWQTRVRIAKGTADGLEYLHSRRILHRDIKSDNILLDAEMVPKIGDFGMSKRREGSNSAATAMMTMVVFTQGYEAPEVYGGRFTSKSDVYSLGVVLLELVTGRPANAKNAMGVPLRGSLREHVLGPGVSSSNGIGASMGRAGNFDGPIDAGGSSGAGGAVQITKADPTVPWPPEVARALMELGVSCTQPNDRDRPTIQDVQNALNALLGEANSGKQLPCQNCLGRKRDTVLLPCRHALYCVDCATHHLSLLRCPCCRGRVEDIRVAEESVLESPVGPGFELGDSCVQDSVNLAAPAALAKLRALLKNIKANKATETPEMRTWKLTPAGVRRLAESLQANTSLRVLNLSKIKLDEAGLEAFAQALKKNSSVVEINLFGNEMGPASGAGIERIVAANASIRKLKLKGVFVGSAGLQRILQGLRSNTTISALGLSCNKLDSTAAAAMAEFLRTNTTIRDLGLSCNQRQAGSAGIGDEGVVALADALSVNSTVTELSVYKTSMGPEGAKALAESLKLNRGLRRLGMEENQCYDSERSAATEALEALGEALRVNTTLTDLRIQGNKCEDEDFTPLAEALKTNSTLQELIMGNNRKIGPGLAALVDAFDENPALAIHKLDISRTFTGKKGREGVVHKSMRQLLTLPTHLSWLNLDGNFLGPKGAEAIAKGLERNTTLTLLGVSHNELLAEGVAHIAAALKKNQTLAWLGLADNGLQGPAAAAAGTHLADMLACNSGLRSLVLCNLVLLNDPRDVDTASARSHNWLQDAGVAALAAGLAQNQTLTELNLEDNGVEAGGAQALADVLRAGGCGLRKLTLSGNANLGSAGACALAGALASSACPLSDLNLQGCGAADEGLMELAKSLADNTSLRSLDVRDNHAGAQKTLVFVRDVILAHKESGLVKVGLISAKPPAAGPDTRNFVDGESGSSSLEAEAAAVELEAELAKRAKKREAGAGKP